MIDGGGRVENAPRVGVADRPQTSTRDPAVARTGVEHNPMKTVRNRW
jgi:hypothetical protein